MLVHLTKPVFCNFLIQSDISKEEEEEVELEEEEEEEMRDLDPIEEVKLYFCSGLCSFIFFIWF